MKLLDEVSLGMTPQDRPVVIQRLRLTDHQAATLLGGQLESCVRCADTAEIIKKQLGVPVEMNGTRVELAMGEIVILAQRNETGASVTFHRVRVTGIAEHELDPLGVRKKLRMDADAAFAAVQRAGYTAGFEPAGLAAILEGVGKCWLLGVPVDVIDEWEFRTVDVVAALQHVATELQNIAADKAADSTDRIAALFAGHGAIVAAEAKMRLRLEEGLDSEAATIQAAVDKVDRAMGLVEKAGPLSPYVTLASRLRSHWLGELPPYLL